MPKNDNKDSRKLAIIALIVVSALWGVASPVIKVTLNYIPPFSFLTIRFLVASFILYFLVDWKKGYLKHLGKKGLLYALLLGVLGSSVNLGLLFWGINFTTSIEATIIYSMAPILIILGGVVFLKEEIQTRELLGILIALFGFGLIIIKPLLFESSKVIINFEGNILVLLSTVAWVAYALLSKNIFNHDKTGTKYSPVFITFITFFAGAVSMLPFGIYEILTTPIFWAKATPGILYMAVAGTVIAYTLYEFGVKKIEVSETAIFQYLQPLFTIPIAMMFIGEDFSFIYLVGGILVAAGVFLSEHHPVKIKR